MCGELMGPAQVQVRLADPAPGQLGRDLVVRGEERGGLGLVERREREGDAVALVRRELG